MKHDQTNQTHPSTQDGTPNAYYQLIDRQTQADGSMLARFSPTIHAQGAWNDHEQHMAPATGILAYELERFAQEKDCKTGTDQAQPPLRIARISLDILGLIHLDEFSVHTKVIRSGKTIELLEATLSAQDRICIVARAWRLITQDTRAIAGLEDQQVPYLPADLPDWQEMKGWPGGYIESVEFRIAPNSRAGKGMAWLTNDLDMVAGEPTSDFVKLMGMVDTANGIAPRIGMGMKTFDWIFPNTDLQIHLYRLPKGKWLGLEVVQQYGEDGIGLTSAILHDEIGTFGRSEQILTIRPTPKP